MEFPLAVTPVRNHPLSGQRRLLNFGIGDRWAKPRLVKDPEMVGSLDRREWKK